MTPFDMQYSTVIHNERVHEATHPGQLRNTGIWAVRTLPDFSGVLNVLAEKIGFHSQSKPAPSTSRLG